MEPSVETLPASEVSQVIRPAAVLESREAMTVLATLRHRDVAEGGVWSASPTVWQRYDRAWDGVGGTRGTAQLVGTIAVVYDSPQRHEVTIYRVTVSAAGVAAGWTVDSLCDDALGPAGLTMAELPRASMAPAPLRDPFKMR